MHPKPQARKHHLMHNPSSRDMLPFLMPKCLTPATLRCGCKRPCSAAPNDAPSPALLGRHEYRLTILLEGRD